MSGGAVAGEDRLAARACSASRRWTRCGRPRSACRGPRPAPPRGGAGGPPCRRSPRPSPSPTPCRPRRRCTRRRARRRRRGSTSRAARSSRRRRCRRARRRAAARPPRGCPRAGRPARSARTAPSRGRRRTRCARRARAAAPPRSSCSVANGKPSCETSSPVTLARMSRARGPHRPIVAPGRREVGDLRAAVAREVVGEPLEVGHAVRAARDDAEPLVAEPHDRQVGLEAAARRENRRVDDAADGRRPSGARTPAARRRARRGRRRRRSQNAERSKIPARLAHREVLGVDDRRPPARVPLASRRPTRSPYSSTQRRVRLVPLRPLPARRLEEDGAELLLALVHRREPDVPVRRPLLGRVDDAVGLGERPRPRAPSRARRVFWWSWKRRDVGRVAGRSPTRRGPSTRRRDLPTPGPSLTHTAAADQRPFTSGVSPRSGIPSGVSEMRPLIAYFTPTDSSPTISGISSSASLHLRVEVLLRERELGRRERRLLDRGDLLGVVEDRAVRVRADLEARRRPGART